MNVLQYAKAYLNRGFSIIPLVPDGSKKAAIAWGKYAKTLPTVAEVNHWFGDNKHGIGLVCGGVSGGGGDMGLEVLDFDDGSIIREWVKLIGTPLGKRLTIIKTPSGGHHVPFLCKYWTGATKIAKANKNDFEEKTLVETRGEGSYIATVGSAPGTHKMGDYTHWKGPSLLELPTLTADERLTLWKAARTFDRLGLIEQIVDERVEALRKERERRNAGVAKSTKFGDQYNARTSWEEVLGPHGWTSKDGVDWTRPGKDEGTSASVKVASDGEEVLTVFSSNAGPLSGVTSFKKINKFVAYAILNHGGSCAKAKAELSK